MPGMIFFNTVAPIHDDIISCLGAQKGVHFIWEQRPKQFFRRLGCYDWVSLAAEQAEIMKLFISMISIGIAALLIIASTPARADSFVNWQKWTTVQGCIAIMQMETVFTTGNDTLTAFNWVGDCTPGELITGIGTMEEHTYEYADLGDVYSKTGKMVNGRWEGIVQNYHYGVSPDVYFRDGKFLFGGC